MTIELDSTLAQAEVLFLSFAQVIADIDRRKSEQAASSGNNLRRRGTTYSSQSAKDSNLELLQISDRLRGLLDTGR
jgi:hypothetical protein